jgi:hypothetical protein
MTTQRIKGEIVFSCDRCSETFEPPRLGTGSAQRDWNDTWEDAKRAGWRALKNGKDWEHVCPDCLGKPLPFNGAKTELSAYSRSILSAIAKKPMPRQQISPGVATRLLHENLVQPVKIMSTEFLQITEAGKAMLR